MHRQTTMGMANNCPMGGLSTQVARNHVVQHVGLWNRFKTEESNAKKFSTLCHRLSFGYNCRNSKELELFW